MRKHIQPKAAQGAVSASLYHDWKPVTFLRYINEALYKWVFSFTLKLSPVLAVYNLQLTRVNIFTFLPIVYIWDWPCDVYCDDSIGISKISIE